MEPGSGHALALERSTHGSGTTVDDSGMVAPKSLGVPMVRHRALVALTGAALAALAFTIYPLGADAAIAAFLATVLVVVAATDLERRVIPNRVVLPATAVVLAARIAFFPESSLEFVLAAAGVGLAFLIPSLISSSLMGMGDVKLVVLLGAGLGRGIVAAVIIAFLSTFPFALGTLIRGGLSARKTTLPFGPFLALGALVILLVPRLIALGGS